MCGLGKDCFYLFGADDHVLVIFVLDALDDVLFGDFAAGALVHALVAHRVHAALVQPVKVHAFLCRRCVEANRDVNQSERDGTLPEGAAASGHGALRSLTAESLLGCLVDGCRQRLNVSVGLGTFQHQLSVPILRHGRCTTPPRRSCCGA